MTFSPKGLLMKGLLVEGTDAMSFNKPKEDLRKMERTGSMLWSVMADADLSTGQAIQMLEKMVARMVVANYPCDKRGLAVIEFATRVNEQVIVVEMGSSRPN